MAIVQISKIQQRSGNIVDLPQLDEAEFGWASDVKRLFIGKVTPNENIEVLTSYSNIDFNQINGSYGNLDIDSANIANGQVMTFNGTDWTNRGGNVGGLINLGNVSNVKLEGGAISYVLETDGTGNLSWTPKSTIIAYISAVTKANPAVVTTTANNYFTNGSLITITDVNGMTQLNGNSYYTDVLTSNTFALYSDSGLTTPINSTGYGTYTSNGRAISTVGAGAGGLIAGGSNTTVQFNNNNILDGDADFTWDVTTNLLNVNGNANIGNLNANGIVTSTRFVSNIATGTAPLTITSTTRVSNLSVAYANVSDFGVVTAQTTGTYYLTFVNASTTGNRSLGTNASVSFNAATGALAATTFLGIFANGNSNVNIATANGNVTIAAVGNTTFTVTGTGVNVAGTLNAIGNANVGNLGATGVVATTLGGSLTTAAQPNITSVGTLTGLTVGNVTANTVFGNGTITATGNVSGGNLIGPVANGNSNVNIPAANGNVNISSAGNANILVVTGTGVNVAGTLNATGNLTSSNANLGNLAKANYFQGDGSLLTNISVAAGSTILNGTSNVVVDLSSNVRTSVAGNANIFVVTGTGANIAGTLNVTGNANVGNLGATNIVGTLTTASQTNITSVGTLSSLSVTGNANVGNLGATNIVGTLTTASQTNITSVGTLSSLSVTGNITGNNVISTSFSVVSVGSGISAAGGTQGTATALTKQFNVVSTVTSGTGVSLPTAIAGYRITILNTSANALNVYPLGNGIINSQAANVAYSQPAGARLDFICTSTATAPGGQWYTLNATYG